MAKSNYSPNEAFDFSLEAGAFKKALWQQLQDMMASSVHELDDDDLEYLNAAGTPYSVNLPDDES